MRFCCEEMRLTCMEQEIFFKMLNIKGSWHIFWKGSLYKKGLKLFISLSSAEEKDWLINHPIELISFFTFSAEWKRKCEMFCFLIQNEIPSSLSVSQICFSNFLTGLTKMFWLRSFFQLFTLNNKDKFIGSSLKKCSRNHCIFSLANWICFEVAVLTSCQ